jgi:4-amino-4-deoxy-L-arabinose transferase-like glycosyltransferase
MPTLTSLIEHRPRLLVVVLGAAALAAGFVAMPFWDEDEPRFAAIARTMVETGDWVVPMFNGELAVDKPVLMHWCMALGFSAFGFTEFAARLPSAIAALLTALVLLRAGSRWFSPAAGVTAALAYLGCLLVAIEAHAATPDAILVALTTWGTLLLVEPFLPDRRSGVAPAAAAAESHQLIVRPAIGLARALLAGGLFGLAVLCKGPIGFVGPLVVVLGWVWLADLLERPAEINPVRQSLGSQFVSLARHLVGAGLPAAWRTMRQVRLLAVTMAMLTVAAPWYIAVGLRTDWAWPAGFFFVHNVGRFVAPMERHSGGLLFHPLTMLVGFYPWSCFLPLAVVVAGGRLWRSWRIGMAIDADTQTLRCYGLLLFWMAVWVGGFSLAATKLPNYIMPAYPAAAVLVAAFAVEAARLPRWPFPRWLALGLGGLAFGGIATAATVLVATFFGLTGSELAAAVGLIPLAGAAWIAWSSRLQPARAVAVLVTVGLVYSSLAVGPAAGWISRANTLPGLLDEAHAHAGGTARIGAYPQVTPNIVYYARGEVTQWQPGETAQAAAFLASGSDAVVIVPEDHFGELAASLPRGTGVVGRTRPLFKKRDFLLVGSTRPAEAAPARAATTGSLKR